MQKVWTVSLMMLLMPSFSFGMEEDSLTPSFNFRSQNYLKIYRDKREDSSSPSFKKNSSLEIDKNFFLSLPKGIIRNKRNLRERLTEPKTVDDSHLIPFQKKSDIPLRPFTRQSIVREEHLQKSGLKPTKIFPISFSLKSKSTLPLSKPFKKNIMDQFSQDIPRLATLNDLYKQVLYQSKDLTNTAWIINIKGSWESPNSSPLSYEKGKSISHIISLINTGAHIIFSDADYTFKENKHRLRGADDKRGEGNREFYNPSLGILHPKEQIHIFHYYKGGNLTSMMGFSMNQEKPECLAYKSFFLMTLSESSLPSIKTIYFIDHKKDQILSFLRNAKRDGIDKRIPILPYWIDERNKK